jgi:hypothetical protein
MKTIHLFSEKLGRGTVRSKCGLTLRTARSIAASSLPLRDGQTVCEDCLRAYYKEVCPNLPEVLIGTVVRRPSIAPA